MPSDGGRTVPGGSDDGHTGANGGSGGGSNGTLDHEIDRLANLPRAKYAGEKKAAGARLDFTLKDLDVAVNERRRENREKAAEERRHDQAQSGDGLPASEDEMALAFSERHANDLRHVAKWGRWFKWTGTHWAEDDTVEVYDLIRSVCREYADKQVSHAARKTASAYTISSVEKLAKSDRRQAMRTDDWDKNLWLLGTPDGTVDLRTGTMRRSKPEDYITKLTTVGPRRGCPRWLEFLNRITDGDEELIDFLKRVAGYSLTGSTDEHALFFLYGTGANGKSVFLETLAGIWGDHQRTASMEVFIASKFDHHPTELADLRGARLVTAIETEDGRRWAESRIKALTGGDQISARFMRQDLFVFTPQFKLMIAGNHRPRLRNVDEAMRRRLHLIPFPVTIPPDERDGELGEKLKAEWPGILAWAIEGAGEWKRDGLQPPARVREATNDYLADEDSIAAWIEDQCDVGDGLWAPTRALYTSFQIWCDGAGEFAGTEKAFVPRLEAHGFRRKKRSTARGFDGLAPKLPPSQGLDL